MRVVPLESPLKGHQPLYVFDFLSFSTEYLKQLQSSEPLYAKLNPTSCLFGSRVAWNLVFLLAGALFLMKKSTKVALYFGSDCGMMKFFTFKPQTKEKLMPLPHLWSTVGEKDRGLSTCKP
jgi:hypothetical protein